MIERLTELLCSNLNKKKEEIYLATYGSLMTNTSHIGSDVDLVLICRYPIPLNVLLSSKLFVDIGAEYEFRKDIAKNVEGEDIAKKVEGRFFSTMKGVKTYIADGKEVKFYPSDAREITGSLKIKAITSAHDGLITFQVETHCNLLGFKPYSFDVDLNFEHEKINLIPKEFLEKPLSELPQLSLDQQKLFYPGVPPKYPKSSDRLKIDGPFGINNVLRNVHHFLPQFIQVARFLKLWAQGEERKKDAQSMIRMDFYPLLFCS